VMLVSQFYRLLFGPIHFYFFSSSFLFPAESQGQTNPVFKDYLPGSSDLPEQDKPAEPAGPWKQASHMHNLPPGLAYLPQVQNLS